MLAVLGEPTAPTTERGDWGYDLCDTDVPPASFAEWQTIAKAEHASIASFARTALELMALGAPADSVADTHRAALDEARHARIAYELASRAVGHKVGPGSFPAAVEPIAAPTFASFVRSTFRDACVEETLGAIAMRRRALSFGGVIASAIDSIADDEERHAELAWRTLAWAVRVGGDEAKTALHQAVLETEGRSGAGIREVVLPCAVALREVSRTNLRADSKCAL